MSKIKLAIADDELTSRNTIKSFLENNETYEVTADFSEGKAAVEWIRQNEIDILLCDMQMPEMNGVELMRVIHVINEFLPIIVISGFDDFNFVRGSLINGAENYLLKHELTKDKLINVLDQVREKYRIVPEERLIRHHAGYCIRDEKEFNVQSIQEMTEKGKIDFNCRNIVPVAVSPDFSFHRGVNPKEYKQDICKVLMDMIAQILSSEYKYIIYFTKYSHLILMISFYDVPSTLYMMNMMTNLIERLQKHAIRMLDITLTIVSGSTPMNLDSAVIQALNLESILTDKLYLGGNRNITAALTKKLNYGGKELPDNLWKQLIFELENRTSECKNTLNDIFDKMEDERFPLEGVRSICDKLLLLLQGRIHIQAQEIDSIQERIHEYEIFEQLRVEVLELYNQKLYQSSKEEHTYSPLITKVVDYVRANYANDISLESCAEFTGISYTHLSREFKQETGMRFVEFLNKQRINKAKSLLIRNDVTIKDLVEQSGFRNYNYFFKVFKESEGITPSEFTAKN